MQTVVDKAVDTLRGLSKDELAEVLSQVLGDVCMVVTKSVDDSELGSACVWGLYVDAEAANIEVEKHISEGIYDNSLGEIEVFTSRFGLSHTVDADEE